MITVLRLDERLIHGQIAIKWSRVTGVQRIVVGNDDAASSPIITKSLLMAAPSHLKTAIKSVDDAIKILSDPRGADIPMLALVKNPTDLLRAINECPLIEKVVIGNFGRVEAEHEGMKRKTFGGNLYADDIEIPMFKEIAKVCASKGIPCVYQTTPDDAPTDLATMMG